MIELSERTIDVAEIAGDNDSIDYIVNICATAEDGKDETYFTKEEGIQMKQQLLQWKEDSNNLEKIRKIIFGIASHPASCSCLTCKKRRELYEILKKEFEVKK